MICDLLKWMLLNLMEYLFFDENYMQMLHMLWNVSNDAENACI